MHLKIFRIKGRGVNGGREGVEIGALKNLWALQNILGHYKKSWGTTIFCSAHFFVRADTHLRVRVRVWQGYAYAS
jgi:hypothetical protein